MTNPRRRYFVADDAEAVQLIEDIKRLNNEHRERLIAFLKQYNTEHCIQRRGQPTAILVVMDEARDRPEPPEGFKYTGKHYHDNRVFAEFTPVGNTKVGRAIKKQMEAVGGFSANDIILKHYAAETMVYAGNSMWCATGWPHLQKNVIVVQVPEDDEQLYTPHPSFREIKKSEYVAITEE